MYSLEVPNRLTECAALFRIRNGRFKRSLRDADGLRRDADATSIQKFQRDPQAVAFFSEAIPFRDFAIGERVISAEREVRSPILSS